MRFDLEKHHRRSIRLKGYDYGAEGLYYVTVCVQGRECLFGQVADGEMMLYDAGRIVQTAWDDLPKRFSNVVLNEFIIMPNHVHGIFWIRHTQTCRMPVGAGLALPDGQGVTSVGAGLALPNKQGAASSAPTWGDIVRVFKSISAIAINRLLDRTGCPVWQRNYYERIIRNEDELSAARKYIRENPLKWGLDEAVTHATTQRRDEFKFL